MGIFEIEGYAKKEVKCDIANIHITFRAFGKSAGEVSKRAMEECESFLKDLRKRGFDIGGVSYDSDSVEPKRFTDSEGIVASRSVVIRIPFNMKMINHIQTLLQNQQGDYRVSVNGDILNRSKIRTELAKQALQNSKNEAEQLAETLGVKVKGIERRVKKSETA